MQESPIYTPIKSPTAGEMWNEIRNSIPSIIPRDTRNYIILMVIAMFLISIPALGLLLVKDTQYRIAEKATISVAELSVATGEHAQATLAGVKEKLKLEKAPMVRGMKESIAIEKLKAAQVDIEKVAVTHEKLTFPELVKKTDLFFGEVSEQKVSEKGITLVVPQADTTDTFTVQMLAMGSRLAWPLPGYERLSSHFGPRSSPGGIGSTNHQGIDIPAPIGVPIIAVKEGKVEVAKYYGGYGNCVIINHNNGFKSLYGHMSQITCNVGDTVKPGDIIGKVGSTGNSTGAHLHFGLLKDGKYIDPEPFFTGKENVKPGEEVSENTEQQEEPTTEQPTEETENTKEKPREDKLKENKSTPTTTDPTKPVDPSKPKEPVAEPTKPVQQEPTKPAPTEPVTPTEVKPTTPPTTVPPSEDETEAEQEGASE